MAPQHPELVQLLIFYCFAIVGIIFAVVISILQDEEDRTQLPEPQIPRPRNTSRAHRLGPHWVASTRIAAWERMRAAEEGGIEHEEFSEKEEYEHVGPRERKEEKVGEEGQAMLGQEGNFRGYGTI